LSICSRLSKSTSKDKSHGEIENILFQILDFSIAKNQRFDTLIFMCGIIGYSGPRKASKVLLEGLRRLEYRGYDSAGIAVGRTDPKPNLQIIKAVGKSGNSQRNSRGSGWPMGYRPHPMGDPWWCNRGQCPSSYGYIRQNCGGAQWHHRKP